MPLVNHYLNLFTILNILLQTCSALISILNKDFNLVYKEPFTLQWAGADGTVNIELWGWENAKPKEKTKLGGIANGVISTAGTIGGSYTWTPMTHIESVPSMSYVFALFDNAHANTPVYSAPIHFRLVGGTGTSNTSSSTTESTPRPSSTTIGGSSGEPAFTQTQALPTTTPTHPSQEKESGPKIEASHIAIGLVAGGAMLVGVSAFIIEWRISAHKERMARIQAAVERRDGGDVSESVVPRSAPSEKPELGGQPVSELPAGDPPDQVDGRAETRVGRGDEPREALPDESSPSYEHEGRPGNAHQVEAVEMDDGETPALHGDEELNVKYRM